MTCCGTSVRAAALLFASVALQAQITTGRVEGTLRGAGDLEIAGALGFHQTIHTDVNGHFDVALPYGHYRLSIAGSPSSIGVEVAALQTTHVTFTEPSGHLIRVRIVEYPEPLTLQGALANREASSAIAPQDSTGLGDVHLGVVSQNAASWTAMQFKLMGMDATDSYQPGRPMILPDVRALDEVMVSGSTEIGMFLRAPRETWHGAISTTDTGAFLSSSNLPPIAERGLVQQAEQFHWFTRDSVEAGGPLAKWEDIFAMGTGQSSAQTVPTQPAGNDQRSRMLFGNVRARIRAGAKDQFDAMYSGGRINLSSWGVPEGLELLENRMAPQFDLPEGFPDAHGIDHLDFLQAGWTHVMNAGVIEVRYGESTAHMNTDPPGEIFGVQESKVDLVTGLVTGGPPIEDSAVRTRQGVEGAWQPSVWRFHGTRHQLVIGGDFKTSSPLNRLTIPSDINLVTLNGAPEFVTEFTSPRDVADRIRASSVYAADRISLSHGLTLDLEAYGDLSRGSLPAQTNELGQFVLPESFPTQGDLIKWNNVSPRAGFAWQPPKLSHVTLRGNYLRSYEPLAGRYLDFGNPNSLGGETYRWIDRNGDGQFQLGEEGTLISRFGGQYSSIDPGLKPPYADEFRGGAEITLGRGRFARATYFHRSEKKRIAAIDTGVPASAFTLVSVDGETAYQQNPATFGQDRYLLTNPAGLSAASSGVLLETGGTWHGVVLHGSFVAEKSSGAMNPGNSAIENDPGVIGTLYLDPNTLIGANRRSYLDPGQMGKIQAVYSSWRGIRIASTLNYTGGVYFAREALVTGLAQGPFLIATGSYDRAQALVNWNVRFSREFRALYGRLAVAADVLNVPNAGRRIEENAVTGQTTQLQEPRSIRLQIRYEY